MTIIKNEPLYQFKGYCKPRHIIVEGTDEEIGFDLAKIAQADYGVSSLTPYEDPIYGIARREYYAYHWPAINERSKGARRAYGIAEDDNLYDASALPYDLYDIARGATMSGITTCSGLVLPKEKTEDGKSVFVGRNWDMNNTPIWSGLFGKKAPDGAFGCGERTVVLEIRPKTGYNHILIGCHDLMSPLVDGMNEKGLYFAVLADPNGVGEIAGPSCGDRCNGITSMQLGPLLMDTCATVQEAKKAILLNRIIQVGFCVHVILADATGDATIFEIDKLSQAYVFTDRKVGEPLFVTNHAVSSYPTPDTYPAFGKDAEHNTFNRMNMLNEAYGKKTATLQESDARELMDMIQCSFVDCKKAECVPSERTLVNTSCDLSKPRLSVRFYENDAGPIEGTNHLKVEYSDWFHFSL